MSVAQDFAAGEAAYSVGDYAKALREWTPVADQGSVSAQFNLGIMYDIGQGVPQDYAEAARWFRLAAVQGHAQAQFALGLMDCIGQGVPQNFIAAHMWLNVSAANVSQDAATIQDAVAAKLTPADISEAQRRAKVCMASSHQNFD